MWVIYHMNPLQSLFRVAVFPKRTASLNNGALEAEGNFKVIQKFIKKTKMW